MYLKPENSEREGRGEPFREILKIRIQGNFAIESDFPQKIETIYETEEKDFKIAVCCVIYVDLYVY